MLTQSCFLFDFRRLHFSGDRDIGRHPLSLYANHCQKSFVCQRFRYRPSIEFYDYH